MLELENGIFIFNSRKKSKYATNYNRIKKNIHVLFFWLKATTKKKKPLAPRHNHLTLPLAYLKATHRWLYRRSTAHHRHSYYCVRGSHGKLIWECRSSSSSNRNYTVDLWTQHTQTDTHTTQPHFACIFDIWLSYFLQYKLMSKRECKWVSESESERNTSTDAVK